MIDPLCMNKNLKKISLLSLGIVGTLYIIKFASSIKQKDKNNNNGLYNPNKISKYLLKILNRIDDSRLIFVEIVTYGKKSRNKMMKILETLKTENPNQDDLWIADFYKQKYSREDIIALVNKKAVYFLSKEEDVKKVRLSTRATLAKLIGNSLSSLSTKYPSMEKYFFEPMLDIYAPLKESDELLNFGVVKENHLYRGAMPYGDKPYQQLKELGIKTVINLKIEDSALDYVSEERNLKSKGINLYYLPLPNVAPPTLEQTLEFLTFVYNERNIPVFLHCHRGADRTGVMSAIFRITQGYSASWSLVEAEKYNIASSFFSKKIDFVYDFEKKWIEWKKEGKIPNNLYNFSFIDLLEEKNDEQ